MISDNISNHGKPFIVITNSTRAVRLLINDSDAISKYIKNVSIMSKSTAYVYLRRLASFKNFISMYLMHWR